MKSYRDKYPLPLALFIIVSSTILVSGTAFAILKVTKKISRKSEPIRNYTITHLVQTGPVKNALPTPYLAELLNLSCNAATRIREMDLPQAARQLENSPLIRQATITPHPPDAILVDYTIRRPIAYLDDYENVVFDEEGNLFPLRPFLSPKNLPKVFLNLDAKPSKIEQSDLFYVLRILKCLDEERQNHNFQVHAIDLRFRRANSLGQRQLLIKIDRDLLRLTTDQFKQEIHNYFQMRESLRDTLPHQKRILDLRLPNLCYIGPRT